MYGTIAEFGFSSSCFGLEEPPCAFYQKLSVSARSILAPEKILRAGLLADSSCSQLCCCLLYRFGSTPGWVQQIGLCRCSKSVVFTTTCSERKEHVPVWQVEEMGMMRCEVGGAWCVVRGARWCGLCRCSKSGRGREAVSCRSCKKLWELVVMQWGAQSGWGMRWEVGGARCEVVRVVQVQQIGLWQGSSEL